MSSSAEPLSSRRVMRGAQGAGLSIARVVSPRGTVVLRSRHEDALSAGPTLEELLAAERQVGFAEGRAAGLADGMLAAELERNETLKAMAAGLERACERAAHDRRSVVDEVVGEAVGLVFELVDVLLGAELEQHESPARVAVRRALELAPDGEDVRVRLHPDTCITPAELEELSPTGAVVVVADATVEPTGCVLEVGACRIDAQIGPALERVRAALENVRAHSRNELAP